MTPIIKLLQSAYTKHIEPKLFLVGLSYIKFGLFYKNIDLFHIYTLKGTHFVREKKAKYNIFTHKRLRLTRKERSVWNILWRNFLLLWYIYFLSKCLTVMALSRLLAEEYILSLRALPSEKQYSSSLLERSQQILNFLGRPIEYNEGIMVFYLVLCPFQYIFMNSCQEYYFTRVVPFDSPELRIVFEPKREIERVNLLLRQKLNSILNSMKLYKIHLNSADVKRNNTDKISRRDLDIVMANLLGYERQALEYKFLMMRENPELESMRPSFYRMSIIRKFKKYACFIGLYNFSMWALQMKGMWNFFVVEEIQKRCEYRDLQICDFDQTYSLADKIFLLELWILARLDVIGLGIIYQIWLLGFIKCYYLVMDIRLSLRKLAQLLSEYINCDHAFSSRSQINDQVLRSILKISISQSEFSNSIDFTPKVIQFVFFMMILHIIVIANADLESANQIKGAYIAYVIAIVAFNIYAFQYAWCSAKMVKMESQFWSILEQLKRLEGARQRRFDSRNVEQRMGLDFLVVLWQKMTFSAGRCQEHYIINVFGWKITFEEIININFTGLSFFTLFFSMR